jgi:hypothetical protein
MIIEKIENPLKPLTVGDCKEKKLLFINNVS